jgi:DNA-binding transcriptional LysR family regulator
MQINASRRHLTIRQLEVFISVADSLSFSKASEVFHISQPALSTAVQQLEQSIGGRLFDRHTRSVALTQLGLDFLPMAKKLLESFDQTMRATADLVEGRQGAISIAASPSVMAKLLPRALKRFTEIYPDIQITLYEELFEQCIEMLRSEKVDIAFAPNKDAAKDLKQEPLFTDQLVLICPVNHPLIKNKNVKWSQLPQYPQISLKADSNVRQLIDLAYKARGYQITPVFEVERISSMVSFIAAGHGIGILPRSLFQAYKTSDVTEITFSDGAFSRVLCAITMANKSLSPATQNLIDLCKLEATQSSHSNHA